MRNVVLASLAGVALLAGGHTYAALATPPSMTLSILFDGGYGYVVRESNGLEVINLKGGAGHEHEMMLRLERGAVERGPAPRSAFGPKEWDLKAHDLRIGSYGNSPAGLVVPSTRPAVAAPADFSEEANNLAYFPNLLRFHKDLALVGADKAQSRVLLERGRLSILRAGGCWDFKTPANTIASGVAMVRGNSAIKYSVEIDQASVELLLSPVGATLPVDSLVLKPDAAGEVVVKIGDFRASAPSPRAGERLEVFDHLYGLFQDPPSLDQRVGIYKCAELTPVSPGEECPPALFLQVPDFD